MLAGKLQKYQLTTSFEGSLTNLLIHYIHCNFETETHFSSSWFSPHGILLKSLGKVFTLHYNYTIMNENNHQ
jgi:hypothetical protein